MFHKDIEEILKNKFENEHPKVDHDALWDRVYPEIKKDKKKPLWLLFSALGLVLVGVIIGWSFFAGSSSDQIKDVELVGSHDLVETLMTVDSEEGNNAELLTATDQSDILDQSEMVKSSAINTSALETTFSTKAIQGNASLGSFTPQNWKSNFSNNTFSSVRKSVERKVEKNLALANVISNRDISRLENLAGIDIHTLSFNRPRISGLSVSVKELGLPAFDKVLSLEALFGYGFVNRSLSSLDASSQADLAWRNRNEEGLEAYSADLLLSYRFAKSWSTRVGLDYQMITDRTFNTSQTTEIIPADNAIGIEQLITSLTETKFNYYNSIGIPMQLVYHLGNDSFGLELGTGVRLSRLFLSNGIINTETESYDLDADIENRFGRSVNLDLLGDLGFYLSLSENINWTTIVQYQYGLNGINSSSNPIDQKYNLFKIKTGLTYQF
jgi:hypothetical protein